MASISTCIKAHISGFSLDPKESVIWYKVQVETSEEVYWTIDRRYSDFEALHKKLVDSQGISIVLPPKKLIGNMDPDFVEKRREQLDAYLKSIVQFLGKNPPHDLASFLNLYDYEILFKLKKMAAEIFEKGDRYLETQEPFSMSPFQIYAINERMKLAIPPLDSADKRHDFSHIIDFCTNVSSLEIIGSNIPLEKSTIIPNHYPMDLSPFKSLRYLSLKLINVTKLSEVGSVREILRKLSIQNSHLESTSQLLLCDTLYKEFEEAGSSYVWPNLESLNLSNNVLRNVKDLGKLSPGLKHLDFSFNQLCDIFHLTSLPYLETVSYVGNVITELKDLHLSFGNIKVLDFSRNQIDSLSAFSKLYSLVVLNLSCNRIEKVEEVSYLSSLPCIESLILTGNPVASSLDYRVRSLAYFAKRANDVALDNEKASVTEVDQILLIQAIVNKLNLEDIQHRPAF